MNQQKYFAQPRLTYHFVWCPTRHKACLCGEAARRLEELIREKVSELGIQLHDYRVLPDRVYLSVLAPPTLAPHRIACQIKGHTSRVLRSEFEEMTRIPTLWTRAYVVFAGDDLNADTALTLFEELQPRRRPRGRPPKSHE